MLAVIGGSGLSKLASLRDPRKELGKTPYGEPSSPLTFGRLREGGGEVVFLARHGPAHSIPPHRINYRANLAALKSVGVTHILAVAAVGGIATFAAPESLHAPDQLIDYTSGRANTFFDGDDRTVVHVDFTHPYDQALRQRLFTAARATGHALGERGVYAAVNGPRLETAAEINRMAGDGADFVGMTGMPEAALARELNLPYACLAVVANWAAGRGDSSATVSMEKIQATLARSMDNVQDILHTLSVELA